jgi:hypothetical protein
MLEKIRTRRESHGTGPRGLDDAPPTPGLVTVNHGLHTEQLPVGNMTVGEIRARYRDRFDIDPQSHAVVDGVEVANDTVVRPGQMLMFMRRAGEKGTAPLAA